MMMAQSSSSSSSSAGGGGVGMSRAAKKRARGKKRKESSSSSSGSTGRTITAAAETTTVTETSFSNNDDNNNNTDEATTKKKKVNTSGNECHDDDYDEKKQKRQIGIITTKMKKKKVEDCNDDKVGEGNNSQNNDHGNNDGNEKNNNNCNDDGGVSSSLEVEGGGGGLDDLNEVETQLLSKTLTPRRILLLDDTDDDDDYDGDDKGRIRREELMSSSEMTTQYRARVLLASLLSPSGVSVNDFYDTYWGKRPLLAACHHHHHSNDSTASNFHHDDCINGNSSEGQTNEEKGKLVNKEEELRSRTKIDVVHEQRYHTQHRSRLNGFLTRTIINDMMSKNKLRYGLDLNVTRYADTMGGGKNAGQFGRRRITLDPPPKKRQMKKKKKSVSCSSNSNCDDDEDDNVNSNYDDDVEYIIANPTDVWTNVDTASCTLRLLRPHEHNDNIHTLLSLLEVELGCMVGSNAYLTPLHSQGFAPHYDDVDVFICQLEGYKRWRVYSPMSKRETLPRLSSRDYTEKEMNDDMELVLNVILGPGDVLYMPRGWIHQAETVSRPTSSTTPSSSSSSNALLPDKHSLHLTISAMQNWCWADYLEVLMPVALESAISSDKSTSLREGLPRNFLHYMGTMHQMDDDEDDTTLLPEGLRQAAKAQQDRAMVAKSNQDDGDKIDNEKELEETRLIARERQRQLQQQRQFKEEAKKRIMRVCKQAMSMLDDACDEIGKRFLSDRLPPALLKPEACLTKEGSRNRDSSSSSSLLHHHHHDITKKIWPNTLCRIVRPDIARLVVEDGKAVLYHCLDNSRVYHGTPLSPMEFEIDDAPALEQLLTAVEPHWIMVKDLIHGDVEDKMEIAQTLFDEGILATMLVELPDRSVKTG